MGFWQELKVKHNQPMTWRAAWVVLATLAAVLTLLGILEHFFPQGG